MSTHRAHLYYTGSFHVNFSTNYLWLLQLHLSHAIARAVETVLTLLFDTIIIIIPPKLVSPAFPGQAIIVVNTLYITTNLSKFTYRIVQNILHDTICIFLLYHGII